MAVATQILCAALTTSVAKKDVSEHQVPWVDPQNHKHRSLEL